MHGAWTCYRPGRPRGRHGGREVAVLATEDWIAACFDAPTVEVVETRALRLHPVLASLGPDLLAPEPDLARALALLRAPERADRMIGDALLDQSAVAGLGNVYRSEVCFLERIDPFARVADLPEPTLRRLLEASARLLAANRAGRARSTTGCTAPGERLWVYRRAGRPCRRCGSLIRSRASGALGRRTYWCPACQPPVRAPAPTMPEMGAG
jgi:endonuclease-8